MAGEKQALLESASFGERIAEDEVHELGEYFVETDQWRRLFSGQADVVYGPRGAGKSALYEAKRLYRHLGEAKLLHTEATLACALFASS